MESKRQATSKLQKQKEVDLKRRLVASLSQHLPKIYCLGLDLKTSEGKTHNFVFDEVFGQKSTQKEIFEEVHSHYCTYLASLMLLV